MAKTKKKARLTYDKKNEGYNLEILCNDGEWGLDSFHPMIAKNQDGEKTHVSWYILCKIAELQALGYIIEFPWKF